MGARAPDDRFRIVGSVWHMIALATKHKSTNGGGSPLFSPRCRRCVQAEARPWRRVRRPLRLRFKLVFRRQPGPSRERRVDHLHLARRRRVVRVDLRRLRVSVS